MVKVKGLCCQTVFLENVCGESERLVLSNRFHGECFLVKGERLVLSNRFHGECFLVKGLFLQTVFHGECFLVKRKACFVKPFSWRILFGERLVLSDPFLGECSW